jgi:uncharacterized membrane protein
MARCRRLVRHLWLDTHSVRRMLPPATLARLTDQVWQSEARHRGELRICVEASLPPMAVWRNQSARQRAIELFGQLRVWDTEHNNGVLIYLLVADRRIEVLTDRGLKCLVPEATWLTLVEQLGTHLHARHFEQGLIHAVEQVGQVLQSHYPMPEGQARKPNELPDAVVVI